jgi:hypothetical protein
LLVAGVVLAQSQSSVIKNTAGTEVYGITYTSGAATVTVNGVVSATTLSGIVSGTQITATNLSSSGLIPITITTAALTAPTNTVASGVGLRIRINGTNYVLAAYPN